MTTFRPSHVAIKDGSAEAGQSYMDGSLLPHSRSARSKDPRCESQPRQMGSSHSSGQSPGASFSAYNERLPAPRW
jgi:hypothetical protein